MRSVYQASPVNGACLRFLETIAFGKPDGVFGCDLPLMVIGRAGLRITAGRDGCSKCR